MDLKDLLDLCLSSQWDYYFGFIKWIIEHEWLHLTCDTGCDTPLPRLDNKMAVMKGHRLLRSLPLSVS